VGANIELIWRKESGKMRKTKKSKQNCERKKAVSEESDKEKNEYRNLRGFSFSQQRG
jgi:hypothetical protein